MASNFTFLKTEWLEIAQSARSAEKNAHTDFVVTCFHARRTLELVVSWIYDHDEELTAPYDNQLSSLMFAEDFRNNMTQAVFTKIDYVRRIGNQAVHGTRRITEIEAVRIVQELFHFLYWMARNYTQGEVKQYRRIAV